ncbi:MAG: RHS repeat domain-containing protein [Gemmataceae bacterium]
MSQTVNLDDFGRVDELSWQTSRGTVEDFKYGYDESSNVIWRTNEMNHNFDELYHRTKIDKDIVAYDGQGELTDFVRGVLNSAHTAITTPSRSQNWTIDPLGNFTQVKTTSGSTTITDNRTHDLQNRLISAGGQTLSYDENGNLTSDGTHTFGYDAWNHLVTVNGQTAYRYDAAGREVSGDKVYSLSWQVISENQDHTQYVWSPVYVDAMVARIDRDTGTLFVVQDANWNVTALVNTSGDVVERYIYDPYGRFDVLNADRTPKTGGTAFTWNYLHQGGRWDAAVGLYHFRHRDYSPTLMRWIEQDPISFAGGTSNLYQYEGNGPGSNVDPSGLQPQRYAYENLFYKLFMEDPLVEAPGGPQGKRKAVVSLYRLDSAAPANKDPVTGITNPNGIYVFQPKVAPSSERDLLDPNVPWSRFGPGTTVYNIGEGDFMNQISLLPDNSISHLVWNGHGYEGGGLTLIPHKLHLTLEEIQNDDASMQVLRNKLRKDAKFTLSTCDSAANANPLIDFAARMRKGLTMRGYQNLIRGTVPDRDTQGAPAIEIHGPSD